MRFVPHAFKTRTYLPSQHLIFLKPCKLYQTSNINQHLTLRRTCDRLFSADWRGGVPSGLAMSRSHRARYPPYGTGTVRTRHISIRPVRPSTRGGSLSESVSADGGRLGRSAAKAPRLRLVPATEWLHVHLMTVFPQLIASQNGIRLENNYIIL